MTECIVVLIVQSCEVIPICNLALVDPESVDDLLEFRRNHELHVLALEFLDETKHEWYEELLHQQLSWVVCLLYSFVLGIFSLLCIMLIKVRIWENFVHCFDNVVKLLQLSTDTSQELVSSCSFVTSIDVEKRC